MKFLALVLTVAAAIPAEACKCIDFSGDNNLSNTLHCCVLLDGEFHGGNDCAASSISDYLSNFRACCRTRGSVTSDCDFPVA